MEIEKKFRLNCLPEPKILGVGNSILQGYLFTEPCEMRVRQYGKNYYLTVKTDDNEIKKVDKILKRQEWNQEIPKWVFNALWPYTKGRRIEKTRYLIPFQKYNIEIDEYSGKLNGLIILECEFPNEETAQVFNLPEWVKTAIDVTFNDAYKNKNLAEHGLQKKRLDDE